MLANNIPYKFAQPWASAASPGFINRPIPTVSQSGTAASQSLGFPPATSLNLAAGGTPPDIADFNGMMHYVTSWNQWHQCGGPVYYDAAFAASIGGYPHGSQLQSVNDARIIWTSTVDNNTINPDSGPSNNWVAINGYPWTWLATQTFQAGIQVTGFDSAGWDIKFVTGNVGAGFRNDGANFYLLSTPGGQPFGQWNSYRPFTYNLSSGAVIIDSTGSGTGFGGSVQVTQNLSVLRDAQVNGNFTILGASQINGVFTANSFIRVAIGAKGTNDGNRVVLLGDFTQNFPGLNFGYTIDPQGMIDQTVQASVPGVQGGTINTSVVLPITFPRTIVDALVCFGGTAPPANVGLCCTPQSNSAVLVTTSVGGPVGSGTGNFAVTVRARGL